MHGFWLAVLALTLLLALAAAAAVLTTGDTPGQRHRQSALSSRCASLAFWGLISLTARWRAARRTREIVLILKDGAFMGLRNCGGVCLRLGRARLTAGYGPWAAILGTGTLPRRRGQTLPTPSSVMDSVLLRLRGWIEASHPFPLAAVLLLTARSPSLLQRRLIDSGRLRCSCWRMLCSQLAIGWTNDYVDRESDRLYQPGKPIAVRTAVDAHQMPLRHCPGTGRRQ